MPSNPARESSGPRLRGRYALEDEHCPLVGSDAGDAADLRAERQRRSIQRERRAARTEFENAKRDRASRRATAEAHARAALQLGAQAYWLAEGTDVADREFRQLHKMGRWTREAFGCHLFWNGTSYEQRCPVAIARLRMGLSPGIIARKFCSICDHDLSECPHVRRRAYWVRGVKHANGRCAVCAGTDCNHRPDWVYRAEVFGVIKEVDELREVSFVHVPAQPFARVAARPVDTRDLAQSLGLSFYAGVPVNCNLCLSPYEGLPKPLNLEVDET